MRSVTNKNYGFHYNSDFSGNAKLSINKKAFLDTMNDFGVYVDVEFPCDLILKAVTEYIRSEKISAIEKATLKQLLK